MDAIVVDLDDHGRRGISARDLEDNTFYGLDAEAMVALSHAIEDVALDEANGRLLASFQDSRNFESQRERYWQLAATIEEVRVLTAQKKPRRQGCLKRFDLLPPALAPYWVVMYQGRRAQVLALSRQTNDTAIISEKQFIGFYTFDAQIIERVREELGLALKGKTRQLPEYDRLLAIDGVAKRLNTDLLGEQTRLEAAIAKWQVAGGQYAFAQFATDLDAMLDRLRELKVQLAAQFAQAQLPSSHD